MLALGEICLHRGELPNVVRPGDQAQKQNLDGIPGLACFTLAVDGIRDHMAGFTLDHVRMQILAGLYHAQLCRVMESWSYINLASRTLEAILQTRFLHSLSRQDDSKSSPEDFELSFIFWTCFQLECEILEELSLPQSNLAKYRDFVPYPNAQIATDWGFPPPAIDAYLAHIYLRVESNQAYSWLYNSTTSYYCEAMGKAMNSIQSAVKHSRNKWLPPRYQWKDSDPPPSDLLSARLRARYWHLQALLYRRFLLMLFSESQRKTLRPDFQRVIARQAVQALIESTRAFHVVGYSDRFIFTNIFGTAQTQWGNLLMLAACYKIKTLREFIDRETLSTLFTWAISFFQTIAHPGSVLMAELNILIALEKDLSLTRNDSREVPPPTVGTRDIT
ncbi:hypothetical protein F5B19DRAFT_162946 [Rostrohypoxylon terebratum]|nr:hypothetical protein F5B19DRAFT_162946 [Rostrohypoxylon terebratum]